MSKIRKHKLAQKIKHGYNSAKSFLTKKAFVCVLFTIIILFAYSCNIIENDKSLAGGGDDNTKQFYSISDAENNKLEAILGKNVLNFVNMSQNCKLVVIEDTGNDYNVLPVKIEGDKEEQGVYITKLELETPNNNNNIPYGYYEDYNSLSSTGDIETMKIPDFASQKELIESFDNFPQSETCDGYKNYIANLNIPYTSTNTPNATSTNTSNAISTNTPNATNPTSINTPNVTNPASINTPNVTNPASTTQTSTTNVTYSWQTGDWGTCGKGEQTRTVTCKSSSGATVADSNCTETKPSTSQVCVSIELVLVEKGSFQMGSESGYSDEKPVHTVTITKDFYVGKYEVTQGEWEAVMGSNPSNFSSCGVKCPVENVSLNAVKMFITKLNEKEGTNKYRLLTEAEWEYTARGGNKSKGYTYSGSNTVDNVALYSSNSSGSTHEVGTKSGNELGIYDMSGNVWEWVQDYYSSYPSSDVTDPVNTTTSTHFVIRGGAWNSYFSSCRVARRSYLYSTVSNYNIGFRLAKTL